MAVQVTSTGRPAATAMRHSTLQIEITKRMLGTEGEPFALSLRFQGPSGITVLFGASGAGKTTVLSCVAGVVRPDSGKIVVGDRVLFDSARHIDVAIARRRVGYVFQNLALFPHLTALENVAYGIGSLSSSDRTERAVAMLDKMRIGHLAHRRPRDISGGERQRVALARALVTEPDILLLDEPLSGLDLPTKSRIIDDLRSWNDEHQVPVLYVTHDRAEVFSLAERVILLEKGSVVAHGSPYEVFERPAHELTAQLAGFENIFDATVVELHDGRGTMTCTVGRTQLEVPWSANFKGCAEAQPGNERKIRVGVRAGDILLATSPPQGLSARNVILGRIEALTRRDRMMVAQVDCGVMFEVHLTPHACDALGLRVSQEVWLVIKTHSCHLLQPAETS
jgi:molybdate transport system ATP-binding protein